MKTKIFILAILVSCVSSLNIIAQNQLLTNIDETKNGTIKEVTLLDQYTSKPIQKKVYSYDQSGNRLNLSVFAWDVKGGWIETQKYAYKYTEGKLTSMSFTKREAKSGKWSSLAQNVIYTYDEKGELLSLKNIVVEDVIDNLLVLK